MSAIETVFQVPSDLPLTALLTVPRRDRTGAGTSAPLLPGESIKRREIRYSPNGSHALVLQDDGNLVLYRVADDKAVWATATENKGCDQVTLGQDGDLVVSKGGAPVWRSKTGNTVAALLVGDNGELALVGSNGLEFRSGDGSTWTGPTRLRKGGTLAPDTRLEPGDALLAADGVHALWYRKDGDLALVNLASGAVLAHTGTSGAGAVKFQSDGNLVVYTPAGAPTWSSGTYGRGATVLAIVDGGLQIRKDTTTLWTGGPRSAMSAGLKFAKGAATRVTLPEMVVSYARGLTIEARVLDGQGAILELGNGPEQDSIALVADGTDLTLSWSSGPGSRETCKARNMLSAGRWSHVAVVLGGAEVRFYRDGKLVETSSIKSSPGEAARSRNAIGGAESSAFKAFTGALADVRLWNRSLPAERLLAGSITALLGHEPGLSGAWSLDGAAGARDGSPFGRDGALVGTLAAGAKQYALVPARDELALEVTGGSVAVAGVVLDGNGFTWQGHVCPRDFAAEGAILHLYNGNVVRLQLFCEKTSGALRYCVERDGRSETGKITGVLAAGKWTALCVRQDVDGQLRVFADGVQVGAGKGFVLPGVTYNAVFGQGFAGQLAEVRLWSRMLTTAEIVDTGARRIHGWAPGLIGCWRMDDAVVDSELLNADPAGPRATLSRTSATPKPALRRGLTFGPPPRVAPPRVARTDTAMTVPGVTLADVGLSLQLWLNRDPTGEGRVFNLRDKQDKRAWLDLSVSKVGDLVIEGGSGSQRFKRQLDGLIPAKRWTQISLTIDADGLCCVYRDGRLIAREDGVRVTPGLYDKGELGGGYGGLLSEVRVWSRPLTESEVGDNWKRRLSAGSGLVACWPLAGDLAGAPGSLVGSPSWCEAPSLPLQSGPPPHVASLVTRASLLAEKVNNPTGAPLLCLDMTARDDAGAPLADVEVTIVVCYPGQPASKPEEEVKKIDLYRDTLENRLELSKSDRPSVTVRTSLRGSVRVVFPVFSLLMPILLVRHAKMGEGEWTLVTPDQLLHQTLATLTPAELQNGRRATATTKAGRKGLVQSGATELAGMLAGMLGAAANFSFEAESTAALAFDDGDEPPPPAALVPASIGRRGATFQVDPDVPLTRRLGVPTAGLAVPEEAAVAEIAVDGDVVMPESFGLVSWVKTGFTVVANFAEQAIQHPLDTVEAVGKAAGQLVLKSIQIVADTVINGVKIAATWTVSRVEEMVGAVVSLFKAIGKAIGDVIDYIAELFDWGDILETAEVLLDTLRGAVESSRAASVKVFNFIEGALRTFESDALKLLGGSGVVPAIAAESSAGDRKDDEAPEPGGLFDFLLSLLPDSIEESIRALLAVFDPVGDLVKSVWSRLPALAAGVREEFNDPALQASLANPARFFDSDPADWLALARLLVKVVANTAALSVDLAGDLLDAVFASFLRLIDLRINIPVLTKFLEDNVLAGKTLTVGRLLCLVLAIPTTVAYKAVTGKKTGPFATRALNFAESTWVTDNVKERVKRVFGMAVTLYGGILDGFATVNDEFKGKFAWILGKWCLNVTKAVLDGQDLLEGFETSDYSGEWKRTSDTFNIIGWVIGGLGLCVDLASLYYLKKGESTDGIDHMSGVLGAISGGAGVVSSLCGMIDTTADPTTTKGQVGVAFTDLAAGGFDLVGGIVGALPDVDDAEVKAGRATALYVVTGGSAVCQLAGLIVHWSAPQEQLPAVTLYSEPNYRGASCELGIGGYDHDELDEVGDDRVASIKVVAGFRATLFERAGFAGKTKILAADSADLGDFKKVASSVKVHRI